MEAPWVGVGVGRKGKKRKEKKTHFSVFFFLRRPKSLRGSGGGSWGVMVMKGGREGKRM